MARYKTFSYLVDTKDKSVKAEFQGDWSRGDLDRMHKMAMRQLSKHKLEMRRNDERTKPRAEQKRAGKAGSRQKSGSGKD